MPFFTNPFTRNDRAEFLGVVVPLSQATRHEDTAQSSDNSSKDVISSPNEPKDETPDKLDRIASEEVGAASNPEFSPKTIESIRAEVEAEISASKHDSSYDRMSYLLCLL